MSLVLKKWEFQDNFTIVGTWGLSKVICSYTVEGFMLLSFKKNEYACYLVQYMLALQCSYVQRFTYVKNVNNK